jgi:hypothetical protein|nr:MAG TPA: putative peptidoglycan binding domain protein [Caudoviricetes sp.]
MSCTVQNVLAVAAAEVGTMESPANSNNVKYNTWYYGRAVSGARYSWCVTFVQWVLSQCGGSKLLNGGKKTASCSVLADYAKKKNQWVTGNYQPGDLVFMNFSNTTATQHIGIVECVKDGYVCTIEGNTSSGDAGSQSNGGMVARRRRAPKYIVGGYRPKYELEVPQTPVTVTCYLVKAGSIGTHVKALQHLLNVNGGADLIVDGECGAKTVSAIAKFQKANHLTADGVAGKDTWTALLK